MPYSALNCFSRSRFTAAVRSTFNFSGLENFAFAGGEELWVFINKQLVVQILHDPRSSSVPCRTIRLFRATKQGSYVNRTTPTIIDRLVY